MTIKKLPAIERLILFVSFLTFGLLFYRCIFTLSLHYTYFFWNVFLSFTPYLISKQLIKCRELNFKAILLLSGWLILFPSCVYLFTDLLQIRQTDNFSLLYDIVLYVSVALNGLLPGLMSLKKVELFLREHLSVFMVKISILVCFFLSGYSTYVVDFLHLKRWEFFADTKKVIRVSEKDFLNPANHVHVWMSIFSLVILLDILYEGFKKISHTNTKTANEISVF